MPFVRITLNADPGRAARERLARRATSLMADLLGKRADLTSVLVEVVKGTWSVGDAIAPRAAHIEALVTTDTNTAAEKARFVEAAMALLEREVPGLYPATYAVIREVPASDWGWGGLTQEARRPRAAA
ncbi:MAG: tautomerase family protein [Caulobacter sp.]|nr:tautomerase family protein [Caulobacter sp.]